MNLPNLITAGRFALAIVYFVMLGRLEYSVADTEAGASTFLWDAATAIFLVAALSDILDGYLARKTGQITAFGRVADPLVDKIIVCGSFVFFMKFPPVYELLQPWMVVVVIAREFLIHGVRSLAESQQVAFGSNWLGKLKMFLQCAVATGGLIYVAHLLGLAWALIVMTALVWSMLLVTVLSAAVYLVDLPRAIKAGWSRVPARPKKILDPRS